MSTAMRAHRPLEDRSERLHDKKPLKNHKLTCPHCQQVHAWTKKDVVLAR
jgi:hypothetical protein